jgi:hypothetical protein
MRHGNWHNLLAGLAIVAGLAGGASRAQTPAETVLVLRGSGETERRCVVEQSTLQADGSVLYLVRDLATGQRLRVKDNRRRRDSESGQIVAMVTGPDAALVAHTPTPVVSRPLATILAGRRVPTNAELAGSQPSATAMATMPIAPTAPTASVPQQIQSLKEALGPSQREMAAMALTVSDAHRSPEVITALVQAAQTDPAPSVRTCLVRCLYQLSSEAPQVIPVLEKMQRDANNDVRQTAQLAMQQLAKPAK